MQNFGALVGLKIVVNIFASHIRVKFYISTFWTIANSTKIPLLQKCNKYFYSLRNDIVIFFQYIELLFSGYRMWALTISWCKLLWFLWYQYKFCISIVNWDNVPPFPKYYYWIHLQITFYNLLKGLIIEMEIKFHGYFRRYLFSSNRKALHQ